MEPPFTPEQLRTLQEISQLPPDQQREKLAALFKKFTPEQLAYLKQTNSQPSDCLFCLLRDEKISTYKVYEDATCFAVLDIRPATQGHLLVIPKAHESQFTRLPSAESSALFAVVHRISSLLVSTLKSAGVTVLLQEGQSVGQTVAHVSVHIIPRFEDDGLSFAWSSEALSPEGLKELQKQLTPLLQPPRVEEKKQPSAPSKVVYREERRIP